MWHEMFLCIVSCMLTSMDRWLLFPLLQWYLIEISCILGVEVGVEVAMQERPPVQNKLSLEFAILQRAEAECEAVDHGA